VYTGAHYRRRCSTTFTPYYILYYNIAYNTIHVDTRRKFNPSGVFIVTKFTCKQPQLWTIALCNRLQYTPKANHYDVITTIIITRYREFTSGTLAVRDNHAGETGRRVGFHNCKNIIIRVRYLYYGIYNIQYAMYTGEHII